jgi:hypothetical protein
VCVCVFVCVCVRHTLNKANQNQSLFQRMIEQHCQQKYYKYNRHKHACNADDASREIAHCIHTPAVFRSVAPIYIGPYTADTYLHNSPGIGNGHLCNADTCSQCTQRSMWYCLGRHSAARPKCFHTTDMVRSHRNSLCISHHQHPCFGSAHVSEAHTYLEYMCKLRLS